MLRRISLLCAAFSLALSMLVFGHISALPQKILYMTNGGPSQIYSINSDGTNRTFLTNGVLPRISPDGTKFVFRKDFSGGANLYIMNTDGTNERVLTPATTSIYDILPQWSPDGTKIVFVRGDLNLSGGDNLFTINVDGTGETNLTPDPSLSGDQPQWSPDGTQILFTGGQGTVGGIFIMNADGSNVHLVMPNAQDGRWSPYGNKIVFVYAPTNSSSEIGVINIDGSNLVQLTNTMGGGQQPSWSPDGSRIVFVSTCACGGGSGNIISVIKPDGTERQDLAFAPASGGDVGDPTWSPDSSTIVFVESLGLAGGPPAFNQYRLFSVPAVGGTQLEIYGDQAGASLPVWGYQYGAVVPDSVAPTTGPFIWSANPKTSSQSSTLSLTATDNSSGVAGGEYFIGDADPGLGKATTMSWNGTNLTTTFGTDLLPGVYQVNVRAEDQAGNWSQTVTDYLVVFDPVTTLGVTGKNNKDLVPSLANGDILPGLIASNQTDAANYGFTVDYKNGVLDPHNDFQFTYQTGTHCNNGNAQDCHSFNLNATSFAWLVIDQTNNSRGRFQGTATLTVDGVTTTNPFTVEGLDGDRLTPATNDNLVLKVYAPGANPATATPIYQASGAMTKGNSVKVR